MYTFKEWLTIREDFANEPIIDLFKNNPLLNDRQVMLALRRQGINIPFSRVVSALASLRDIQDSKLDRLIGDILRLRPNLSSREITKIATEILRSKGDNVEPFQIMAAVNKHKLKQGQQTQGHLNPYLNPIPDEDSASQQDRLNKLRSLGSSSVVKPYGGYGGRPVKGAARLPSPDFGQSTGGGRRVRPSGS